MLYTHSLTVCAHVRRLPHRRDMSTTSLPQPSPLAHAPAKFAMSDTHTAMDPGAGKAVILEFLRMLCGGDTAQHTRLLDWSTHAMQHPNAPGETALVSGPQRCGESVGPRGPVDRRGPTVTVCRFAAPTATVTGRRRAHRTGPEFRFSHAPLRRRTLFRL